MASPVPQPGGGPGRGPSGDRSTEDALRPGISISRSTGDALPPSSSTSSSSTSGSSRHARMQLAASALAVVEGIQGDAAAAAAAVQALLGEVSTYLHQVTENTASHTKVERDAAGLLQAAALEATSRGNKLVNNYLRLHEELKDLPKLCLLVKALRQKAYGLDQDLRHLLL